jgi:imidazoleglycerol phosphate synthase glutamine amidotransferase subunit HisH
MASTEKKYTAAVPKHTLELMDLDMIEKFVDMLSVRLRASEEEVKKMTEAKAMLLTGCGMMSAVLHELKDRAKTNPTLKKELDAARAILQIPEVEQRIKEKGMYYMTADIPDSFFML